MIALPAGTRVWIAAGATDVLDGWWARRFGQTSPMGAVVDGATDKIFVLGVVITLAVTHRLTPWQAVVLGARGHRLAPPHAHLAAGDGRLARFSGRRLFCRRACRPYT